ncbi:hypothetical protein GPA10_37350 [Streptomyces sp. p1417]|uniref:Uncharacterized protein n=1 Tax=Streptomyces typhae TaxID=2681492 RepID=A0A6L6XAI4_9ACTN|nr:hypothetical protein [Streptomyces typhae]MVO90269.1 hypothetical protein [Streptomyces typhae]
MPPTTSKTIADRIEDLYGQPIAVLEAYVESNPTGTMLAALTSSHADLQLAERTIAFQLQRLRELAAPRGEVGPVEAGHLLDCARRIAESVAARDAHAKTADAVLNSLHRTPVTPSPPPAAPAVPAPAVAPAAPPVR